MSNINYYGLLLQAKEKYPWGTKTVKGKSIGEVRWNKDLTKIVSDTVILLNFAENKWVDKIEND